LISKIAVIIELTAAIKFAKIAESFKSIFIDRPYINISLC
jgi:hypothetical protein